MTHTPIVTALALPGMSHNRTETRVAPGGRWLVVDTPAGPVSVREGTATFTRPEAAITVELGVNVERGRVEVVRLEVAQGPAGPALSVRALQRLGVGPAIEKAFELFSGAGEPVPSNDVKAWLRGVETAASPSQRRAARRSPATAGGRRPSYTPAQLRRVAKAYTKALERGEPTTPAVVEAAGLMTGQGAAARKLVERMRKATDPRTGRPYLPGAGGTTRPKSV